ncbi:MULTISPECIES: DUF5689 domain-containing protein [Chitinophagaceae]
MKNYIILCCCLLCLCCSPKFDRPPLETEISLQSNLSIRALKLLHSVGQFERIQQDAVIEGVVVADDKSGNFYQSIVMQDSTGGIVLRIAGSNLYSSYPIGRKLYVKVKGLLLGDYGGNIQLGGGIDSSLSYRPQLDGIAPGIVDLFIVKGAFNQMIRPRIVKPSDLTDDFQDSLQSTLVAIENMQFNDGDLSKPLADASKQVSAVSFVLQDCFGEGVVVRNSSYANFSGIGVPKGNGILAGIFTLYNSDKQIIVRDTGDFSFNNNRCDKQLADTNKITTIKAVRNLYKGKTLTIPFGTVIKGTIISNSKNEASGNYKIQDGNGSGIILYGANLTNLEWNKSYVIDIGGASVEQFSNELEITKIATSKIYQTSSIPIVPRVTNIAQVNDSLEKWNATLVQLQNVYISAPTVTSSGRTYTIMDNKGSVETFIRSTAAFNLLPGNANTVTGYVSLNQGKFQLILRVPEDVSYSGGTAIIPIEFSSEYSFKNVTKNSGTVDPGPVPSVSDIAFGAFKAVGLSANPSAAGRFVFTYWPLGANSNNNDFTGTIDIDKYYEVTITPDAGAKLSLSLIEFVAQRSATGPRQWVVRSSLDNFQTNIAGSVSNSNVRLTSDNIFQIASRSYATAITGNKLLLGDNYSNLQSGISFRFYAFNGESNAGSFSLNSVRFDGKVE